MTDSPAKAIAALVKAKKSFKEIKKDKTGNRSAYASLDSVLSATEPALLEHGLVVVQHIESAVHEDGRTCMWLKTRLYHESGEELPVACQHPLPTYSDAQKFGAALTYARRYSYCALLGVTADEDDDAESTKAAGKSRANPQDSLAKQRWIKAMADYGYKPDQYAEVSKTYLPTGKMSGDCSAGEIGVAISKLDAAIKQLKAGQS